MKELESVEIMVCVDCLMAIANDDYTGLDYYLSPLDAGLRKIHIERRLQELGNVVVGDHKEDETFSSGPCDCCYDRDGGSRFQCFILQ